MYVPSPGVVRWIGQPIVRAFRARPVIFLAVCIVGVAVGVVMTFHDDARTSNAVIPVRVLGVIITLCYLGAGVFWLIKVYRGTWGRFCDWWLSVLDHL